MSQLRIVAIVAAVILVGGSQQLPTLTPHELRPIPWPADSPTPDEHSGDYAQVFVTLSGDSIGIQRSPVAWGTGVIDEWYFVFAPPPQGGPLAGSFHTDSLWAAPSFYDECGSCATGDSRYSRVTVAGCLFVADDSLLAYAAVSGTTAAARSYADSTRMRSRSGYYRLLHKPRRLVKVANIDPSLLANCRAQLTREARTVDHP